MPEEKNETETEHKEKENGKLSTGTKVIIGAVIFVAIIAAIGLIGSAGIN